MDRRQPDLHHEGPLTTGLIKGLLDKLKIAVDETTAFEPVKDSDWEICQSNWERELRYAGMRMAAIYAKLSNGIDDFRADDDRKCVDITLCILRDFEVAKSKGFIRDEP